MAKERIAALDVLRGFAIIGVVVIHATVMTLPSWSSYSPSDPFSVYLNQLFRFATPLFLFLSGVTLTISQQNKNLSIIQFYKKRVPKIIVPYMVFSILLTFYYYPQLQSETAIKILHNIVTGKADYHMYFILLLLQAYILFPLLYVLFKRLPINVSKALTILLIIMQTTGLYFYQNFRLHSYGVSEDSAFRNILFWLVYFLLGIITALWFDNLRLQLKKIHLVFMVGVLIISAGILTAETWYYSGQPNYDALNFFRPSIVLFFIIAILALYQLAEYIQVKDSLVTKYISRFFQRAGKHSLGIYFIHTIVLSWVWAFVRPLGFGGGVSSVVLIGCTLIISISIMIAYNDIKSSIFQSNH